MIVRCAGALLAILGLVVTGCGPAKLNENHTFTMEPGDVKYFDLDPISKPQTITVDFSSSNSDAYVYVLKDCQGDDGVNEIPPKEKIVASKNGKSGTLTVDVAAQTATRVLVRGVSQKTEVKLTMTN
ncbi:MAG: hypothetical protein RMJ56_01240 [Gemmataceae bacterium]|nr:hypothetical protein [Gemmata sp.]MDW8196205.1 hypothetical protein [Gemmataceae bacterium]